MDIEELAGNEQECLNLRSEWSESKLPWISVRKTKGTSGKEKKQGEKKGANIRENGM